LLLLLLLLLLLVLFGWDEFNAALRAPYINVDLAWIENDRVFMPVPVMKLIGEIADE
jgi:hypothetical protein